MTDNWANRKKGMRCERCMWWAHKANNVGRCRRHAPGSQGDPGWPVVMKTDWCGDFRLTEDAEAQE